MELYKYDVFLEKSASDAFDKLFEPSNPAPWAGIYKCHACGHEIGIAAGHTLPSQNHHQHAPGLGSV